LKNLQSTFQDAAKSVEQSVNQAGEELQSVGSSLKQSVTGTVDETAAAAPELPAPEVPVSEAPVSEVPVSEVASPVVPAPAAAADAAPSVSAQMDLGLESTRSAPAAAPKT
jgi:hypothetical protein